MTGVQTCALPICENVRFAAIIISTGAVFAQDWFPGTNKWSNFSYASPSDFLATKKRHGCSLYDEAAQRAASSTVLKSSFETGREENERGLHRERISSWTAGTVSASFSGEPTKS